MALQLLINFWRKWRWCFHNSNNDNKEQLKSWRQSLCQRSGTGWPNLKPKYHSFIFYKMWRKIVSTIVLVNLNVIIIFIFWSPWFKDRRCNTCWKQWNIFKGPISFNTFSRAPFILKLFQGVNYNHPSFTRATLITIGTFNVSNILWITSLHTFSQYTRISWFVGGQT